LRPCDRRITPSFEATGPYGAYGERVAACFLRRSGYRVLLRNVAVGKSEIDLVCREGEVLAFVEVKTRRDAKYGEPSEAVDARKRAHLVRASKVYLDELRRPSINYRFDIAEVFLVPGELPRCRLIRDAFGVHERV
jgi:putative endonuclease